MRIIYFALLSLLFSLPTFRQNKVAKQAVLEDLHFLRQTLDEAHHNLYAYVTKNAFDAHYEKIKSSITADSLSILEITSLFQAVVSKANNGHTEIPFPSAAYIEYAYAGGSLFPLEIAFESGKALIRKNWSDNGSLQVGTEITSINEQPIQAVLEEIYPLISAERRYFKLSKLELISFPRLYWQAFGEQKDFVVTVKKDNKTQKYQVEPINLIEGYEKRRNELFSTNRELQFINKTAYLKPGNFSGDEQKYRHFIDSTFAEIQAKNLPNLIIDLRNNLGGDDSFSDYLVSYIADRPFRWCSEFTLKTSAPLKAHVRDNYDTTKPFWQSVLTHEDGDIYPYAFEEYEPQPKGKRYSGTVYILINRQSHSQATVTAAQIQDYTFGTLVGEETGEFSSLYASQFSFILPNTAIEVKLAKGYIVRINGSKKAEGLIPDLYIKDHLLDEKDEILDGLLKQIDSL